MQRSTLLAAAAAVVGLWASTAQPTQAQEASKSTFRDLVRKYMQDKTKAQAFPVSTLGQVNNVVALEYTVLLKTPDDERAVDPNTFQFKIGDQIRVQIQPLNDMYIYIFHEGASGDQVCLLPTEEEKAPRAKAGEVLKLPADGYFEFAAPPGDEKLIVVATEEPITELGLLSNLVFKKPDEELTEAEKEVAKKLRASASKSLKNIRDRQAANVTYRGILNEEAVKDLNSKLSSDSKTNAVIEEPPTKTNSSTFAMSAGKTREDGRLLVNIPLRSVKN